LLKVSFFFSYFSSIFEKLNKKYFYLFLYNNKSKTKTAENVKRQKENLFFICRVCKGVKKFFRRELPEAP